MRIALSEDQRSFAGSVRGFLDRHVPPDRLGEMEAEPDHDRDLWDAMLKMGWPGLLTPSRWEGSDADLVTTGVLLEECGRHAVASPLYQSLATSFLLNRVGDASSASILGRDLGTGDRMATIVGLFGEPIVCDAGALTTRRPVVVEWAVSADVFVVIALLFDGYQVFEVPKDSPGVVVREAASFDNEKVVMMSLNEVAVAASAALTRAPLSPEEVSKWRWAISSLRCAEMVGGARRMLEMTIQHVDARHQFGRPLSSFQSIQHACADMAIDVDGSWLSTQHALWSIDVGVPHGRSAATAVCFTSEAVERVALKASQFHGGIGFMKEFPLNFFYRRAKAQQLRLGSRRDRVAAAADLLLKPGRPLKPFVDEAESMRKGMVSDE